MHINTDMSIDCSTTSSATTFSTDHESGPYSTQVSNFTLTTPTDTLLTPISITGSPASRHSTLFDIKLSQHQQQQRQQQDQLLHKGNRDFQYTLQAAYSKSDIPTRTYLQNNSTPMSQTAHQSYPQHQQPTPPSTMNYPYDNVSGSSTIGGQSSAPPSYELNYQYNSPRGDLPTTMENYSFNSYTATASPPSTYETSGPSLYAFNSGINGQSQYIAQTQQRLPPPNPAASSPYTQPYQGFGHQQSQGHQNHSQGLAPILSTPRPVPYRSTSDYAAGASIPSMSPGLASPVGQANRLTPSTSNDHRRSPRNQPGSIGSVNPYDANGASGHPGSGRRNNGNRRKSSTPEEESMIISSSDSMELNEKATPEERELYDCVQRSMKVHGKGMWEAVKSDLEKQAGSDKYSSASLQMKLGRAYRRVGKFPRADLEHVIAVYEREEKAKYKRYADILNQENKAKGKSKSQMQWRASMIESIFVRLGFEEVKPDNSSRLRRRKQLNLRKMEFEASQAQSAGPWDNNGYVHGAQQYPLPSPQQPHTAVQSHYEVVPAALTAEQESTFMDELDMKYGMSEYSDDGNGSHHSNSPSAHAMTNGASTVSNSAYPRPLPSPTSVAGSHYGHMQQR